MATGLGLTTQEWLALAPAEKTAALKRAGVRLVPPLRLRQDEPKFCHCSHAEHEHTLRGVCAVIIGPDRCGCEHFVEESHCLGACGAELNDTNGDVNGYCNRCARLLKTAGSGRYEADARD